MTTNLVAILIGSPSASSSSAEGVPVVVWSSQSRVADKDDPWRQTLTYFEFLDDQRWTHLDALLTRLAPIPCIHVGTTENMAPSKNSNAGGSSVHKKKTKNRIERHVESLKDFIETRSDLHPNDGDLETSLECHVHLRVPVDSSRLDSIVSQLLVEDQDAKLAYRGNAQLAHNGRLQQGLSLWLHAQGLLSNQVAMDHNSVAGSFKIETGVLTSHLALDRTAAQCIHLLPPATAGEATYVGGSAQNNSLLGILSRPCLTKMGKQKMEMWLRQPLIELQPILYRQEAISALLGLGKEQVRAALRSFAGFDLNQLAATLGLYGGPKSDGEVADSGRDGGLLLGGTKTPLCALYKLYLVASEKLPQLKEAADIRDEQLQALPKLLQDSFDDLHKLCDDLKRAEDLVEQVLDLHQAPREYFVLPTYKEELRDLKVEIDNVQKEVKQEHENVQNLWTETTGSSSQVRLEQDDKDGRWQFRLPDTNEMKTVETLCSRIKVHRVLKNGVYFSTLELRQLSCKFQELTGEYQQHSRDIVRDVMLVASTYQPVVEKAAEIVATLDVLCALAHVAAYSPHGYCKPVLTDGEEEGMGIELKGARHPCVELQENVDFIPNDVSLIFGESAFMLQTGPNMGGKSTYIRAVGAIVVLAQIGSFVPCQSAKINICHSILARVGAGDLQDRGISTFMAEMLEASSILRTATKRSLIVIDELGRGTSTFDGYGLARAISEYILDKIGCMCLFATHFHELTELESTHAGVKNCHVTARSGNQGLTFLYQVKPGPCLESFGIQVAEMANVPPVVIEDAKRKARELENFQLQKKARNSNGDGHDEKTASQSDISCREKAAQIDIDAFLKQPFADDASRQAAFIQLLEAN